MRKMIFHLILEVICLTYFSCTGIGYAITNPSWRLLIYGALIMAYSVMTIINVRDLIKAIRVNKLTNDLKRGKELWQKKLK